MLWWHLNEFMNSTLCFFIEFDQRWDPQGAGPSFEPRIFSLVGRRANQWTTPHPWIYGRRRMIGLVPQWRGRDTQNSSTKHLSPLIWAYFSGTFFRSVFLMIDKILEIPTFPFQTVTVAPVYTRKLVFTYIKTIVKCQSFVSRRPDFSEVHF